MHAALSKKIKYACKMWKSYKENDGTNLTVFEHAFLSHKSCRRDIRDQPNSFEFVI